ncbi:TPA: hypothetical protein ACU21O_001042 [Mannheimia haemolytica]
MNVLDLKALASSKANIVINGDSYTTLDLKGLAGHCYSNGVTLTIKEHGNRSILDLKSIASMGKGNVVIDLT